jgi:parvulin-like peptidyl-prolyl isomerase
MRRLLPLLLMSVIAWTAEPREIDRPVCYVNDAVITKSDIGERLQEAIYLLRQRGGQIRSADEVANLRDQVLQSLIDEHLLALHADDLKVQIDSRAIRREIVHQASIRGLGSDMATIAQQVERRMQQMKIEQVLLFYEQAQPEAGPEELRRVYDQQRERFRQPNRIHLRQILLPTTDAATEEGLRRQLLGLVRVLRGHANETLRAQIDAAFVDQVVEAEGGAQLRLLAGLLSRLLALPDLDALDPALAKELRRLQGDLARLSPPDQTMALARLLRGLCLAVDDPAHRRLLFAPLAGLHGTGTEAVRSGDLGLVEPGTLSPAQREAVLGLGVGDISEPFPMGQGCGLLMVVEQQAARVPGLAEVSGEIESLIRREMRERVRTKLLAVLRARADITRLELGDLPPQ